MTAKILSASDPTAIERAADVLRAGGIVAYPTDTVYGLGANVFSPEALDKVMDAKQRPDEKSLPVLVGDRSHLRELVQSVPPSAKDLIGAFWPGALTIVLVKQEGLSPLLGETTLAVRQPNHTAIQALLAAAGFPITGTSANLSGRPPATTAQEAAHQLGSAVDLILDGGPAPGSTPSTVIDCTVQPARILREGAVTRSALAAVLGDLAP
ncbi:MAG: threonylcarbamoyl-AMP synthase [Chloroflexi bacterium]|nr:threonylcarbamoyl-AMP synthase [Chloroflexota bacterium]